MASSPVSKTAYLMMRLAFLSFLLFHGFASFCQQKEWNAQLMNMQREPIPGAHVLNQTLGTGGISDNDGFFSIRAEVGDTLTMTSIGYRPLLIAVDANWPKEGLVLFMQEGAVELNEVTVESIPPIERFKEQIMDTQPKDSARFWYYGVDKPVFKGDRMLEGVIHKKLLYAISQPTSFLYYNLSKAEKEKRKHHKLKKNSLTKEQSEFKFTREWVTEHTGFEGEELTSFIAYCDYTDAYLASTPQYLIMEDMTRKKEAFEKSQND